MAKRGRKKINKSINQNAERFVELPRKHKSALRASIRIGGQLPFELADDFCRYVTDDVVRLAPGSVVFTPRSAADLLGSRAFVDDQQLLCFYTDDGIAGGFPLIEIFALRHGLDYTLKSEGYHKYEPFMVEHRAENALYYKTRTDLDYQPLVRPKDLIAIRNYRTKAQIREALDDIVPDIAPLTSFVIWTPQMRKE